MEAMFLYAGKALSLTLKQLFILLGPTLTIALVMHKLSAFIRLAASKSFGQRTYIYATAIGTVVHELGHAFFCVVFGHRIVEMELFKPSPDGTLGYVNHSYNPRNPYQLVGNFFVGTGPIWFGVAVIYLLSWLLLSPGVYKPMTSMEISYQHFASWSGFFAIAEKAVITSGKILVNLFSTDNLTSLPFYIFVYLVFSIGGHVTLSLPDLKGAWAGFVALFMILWVFNLLTHWIGDFSIGLCRSMTSIFTMLNAIMVFSLLINVVFSLIILVPVSIIRSK